MRLTKHLNSLFRIAIVPIGVLSLSAITPQQALAHGDFVVDWNDTALNTARSERLGAAGASRTYAIVNVAIYDAVNSIDRRRGWSSRPNALVSGQGAPRHGSKAAAAAAAAHAALSALHPGLSGDYDTLLASHLAALGGSHLPWVDAGQTWGAAVGAAVVAARSSDGTQTQEILPAGTGPGEFRNDFTSGQFRNMTPFAIGNPSAYINPPVPALNSPEYAAAHHEVRLLGDAASPNQNYEEIFRFWRGGGGSARPPGEWIKIAIVVAEQRNTTLFISRTARLFALLSMALADGTIIAWNDKWNNQFWRPATAVREASTDGNADTVEVAGWTPRNGSFGSSPEYTSGQSTYAGAGSTILGGFYCNDGVPFTFEGDNAIAGPRSFESFSEAAREAGQARIFAGIHFQFSNQAGQLAGRRVGREILANSLRRQGPFSSKPDCSKF